MRKPVRPLLPAVAGLLAASAIALVALGALHDTARFYVRSEERGDIR